MTSLVLKVVLLALPAVVILMCWQRRGISSPLLNKLSWVEIGGYALWLLMMPMFNSIRDNILPAILFALWPAVAAFSALTLSLCAFASSKGERGFAVSSDLLMFVLWGSSVAALNK